MLRLAHRILSMPIQCAASTLQVSEWKRQNAIAQLIHAALRRGCPIILADNVADYILCANKFDGTSWPLDFDHIGSMMPPFPEFFIEWRTPTHTLQISNDTAVPASGWLVLALPPNDDLKKNRPNAVQRLLLFHCYQRHNGCPAVSGQSHQIAIDNEGNHLATGYIGPRRTTLGTSGIALQTIGFLNCKNVLRRDATAQEAPNAKWQRRQRVPAIRYHTVQIDAGRTYTQSRQNENTESIASIGRALHICRGHFVRYVNDGMSRGLFGRDQFGTFWIPAHTRGSLECGKMITSYNVKAPINNGIAESTHA